CQPTIKKSKSPRQTNSLAHQSILENQLRQSSITTTTTTTTNNNGPNPTKKIIVATIPSSKKVTTSEIDIISQ
ncbi:unnamed protein product, partial [Rotaria magnacalcarata]